MNEITYAEEFSARCNQLVSDHKPINIVIKIAYDEFSKFIRTATKEFDFVTYAFIDDSYCIKSGNLWTLII